MLFALLYQYGPVGLLHSVLCISAIVHMVAFVNLLLKIMRMMMRMRMMKDDDDDDDAATSAFHFVAYLQVLLNRLIYVK